MTLHSQEDTTRVINADEFAEVSELFRLAEDKLKLIERIENEGLVVPSVNELRYAGYHLLHAISAADNQSLRSDEIKKAKNHCQRSIYDTYEVGIMGCIETIRQFLYDFRNIELTDLVPNITQIRLGIDEAALVIISATLVPVGRQSFAGTGASAGAQAGKGLPAYDAEACRWPK